MNQQIKRLMAHKVTIIKQERHYTGQLVPSVINEEVPAFVQYGRKLVVNRQGEEVSAAALVFLRSDSPIDPTHEYWQITQTVPYSRGTMTVIAIDPIDDPRNGKTHHYEVAVQ